MYKNFNVVNHLIAPIAFCLFLTASVAAQNTAASPPTADQIAAKVDEYMKAEIKRELEEEFKKYEESISSAKDMAVGAIQKTQEVIEEQRAVLEKQMNEQAFGEKQRIIEKFEKDMADIVNHYLLAAIGNQIDLTVQLDYIFQYLEQNKQAIIEDIRSGT